MARVRIIDGGRFQLLRFAKTKTMANKIADAERKHGSNARVLENAIAYKGYRYSIWVRF